MAKQCSSCGGFCGKVCERENVTERQNKLCGGLTDRELLELAARAAKIEIYPVKIKDVVLSGDEEFIGYTTKLGEWNRGWFDPLGNDADALRLAVLLQMDLSLGLNGATVDVFVDELCSEDPYAATRRAIVRAAAAIAKERG